MDELNFNEIGIETLATGEQTHQFEKLSSRIIGAAIEVHRELGPGFLEAIYEEALKIELPEQVISQSSGSKGWLIAEFC